MCPSDGGCTLKHRGKNLLSCSEIICELLMQNCGPLISGMQQSFLFLMLDISTDCSQTALRPHWDVKDWHYHHLLPYSLAE